MLAAALDGVNSKIVDHVEDVGRDALGDLQHAPQRFRGEYRRPTQRRVAQDRRHQGLELFVRSPPAQGELLEPARKLNVAADGLPCVVDAEADQRDLQTIAEKAQRVQDNALFAIGSGEDVVHFIDHQHLHADGLQVNDLLGPGVLFAFVVGRYYHPRREERILLFIDMRASTTIAERLGEERFLDFLNRFITDLSLAIAEAGGEIHKYVGDEIIATWTMEAGLNEAACVRACFAALDGLAASGPAYERDFGCRADFRAGLHCGSVVIGELLS